ncbi:MAG: hypothetical protein QNL05_10960 [Gammaproteobacteria bacterium]|nr:hypothetical protein [Gammaproteobacteria bacterium]
MISWHLLYEHLQNNPELLEEEHALDNMAVSSEIDLPQQGENRDRQQEQQALRKLQARLGNAGLQKLINMQSNNKAGTPARKNSQTVAKPEPLAEKDSSSSPPASTMQSPENVSAAPQAVMPLAKQGEAMNAAENAQQSASDSVEQANEKAPVETATAAQPEVDDQLRQAMDVNIKTEQATTDERKLQEKNLLLFISRLPTPSASLWQQISDLFLLLDYNRQQHLLGAIVSFIRTASRPVQALFFSGVEQLPASLRKQFFVSILLQQLIAVFASLQVEPEAEPPPPEEPDI